MSNRARRGAAVPLQGDYPQVAQQEAVEDDARAASKHPFLDGDVKFLDSKTLTTGATAVFRHALGRAPRGWIITRLHAPSGTVNGAIVETATSSDTLTLRNDSGVTVSVAIAVY
jgi:hypothetical protein